MKLRIADINVEICHRYPYLERLCRDYRADFEHADLTVNVTDREIAREQKNYPAGSEPTSGYAEAVCAYRRICLELPRFDAFLLHAAVVEHQGCAYAFAAPSGTGKSTHAALWQSVFGAAARILNGDKPILRFIGDRLLAFGTPWCGKEGWNVNDSAPLAAICFLERGAVNRIRPIADGETVGRLFGQLLMPTEQTCRERFLTLLDRTVREIPAYLLTCNTQPQAATVAYEGMKKGESHDSQ